MTRRANDTAALLRLLRPPPDNIECELAMGALPGYVDTIVGAQTADESHPRVTAHLYACGQCWDNYQGLLTAASR